MTSVLDYRRTGTERTSLRAVICGSVGVACWLLALACLAAALLPADWVGYPYLWLVERPNGNVDGPDNWAPAATYFLRIEMALLAAAVIFVVVGNPRFWITAVAELFGSARTQTS